MASNPQQISFFNTIKNRLQKTEKRIGLHYVDLSQTSADNPSTPELAERIGAKIYKRDRVY